MPGIPHEIQNKKGLQKDKNTREEIYVYKFAACTVIAMSADLPLC
jgi:hypothetical protein